MHGFEDVVGFRDQLHVGIFDAVVHHLDEVAGAARADIGAARIVPGLGRHLRDDRRDAVVSFALSARHHARPQQRAFLAARDAHADEAQAEALRRFRPALGVGEQRIAGVDENVAFFQERRDFLDHLIDRLARLDHDDDHARLGERADEFLQRLGREKLALRAVLFDQAVGALEMAVVKRHGEAFARRVARQVRPHHRQPNHAQIACARHRAFPVFNRLALGFTPLRAFEASLARRRRDVLGNA